MTASEFLRLIAPSEHRHVRKRSFEVAPYRVVYTASDGSNRQYTASGSKDAAQRDARRKDVRTQRGRVIYVVPDPLSGRLAQRFMGEAMVKVSDEDVTDAKVDFAERPAFFKKTASAINAAAKRVGVPSPRKVWIHEIARDLGVSTDVLARQLVKLQRMGLVKLQRADYVAAFDSKDVDDSTVVVKSGGTTVQYNFVVV